MTFPLSLGKDGYATRSPAEVRRAFFAMLLIELWERFGYYGVAVLLVLFMVQKLGIDDARVNLIWGAFSALIFAVPAIGGWIGDKVLGAKRCLVVGGSTLALGYLLLSFSGERLPRLFTALGIIVVGNAFFRANAANLIRRIYERSDGSFDSAFTLYYMANNVAASLAVLLTPWIKDRWSWHAAFAVCGASCVIGLIHYALMARALFGIGSRPDLAPLRLDRLAWVMGGAIVSLCLVAFIIRHSAIGVDCVFAGSALVLGIFLYMIVKGSRSERPGLIAALILLVEASLFFVFYQQVATSLTLFALRNVDKNQTLFGHHLFDWSPAQYPAVNAIWIILLSPMLAWIYRRLGHRDLPVASKFAIGFVAVAVGFFSFGLSAGVAVAGKVPSWVMIVGYGFYSLGELLVAALGFAMISRYVPARMGGFMMGAFFVAAGVSEYLGSMIANLASVSKNVADPLVSLVIYTRLFDQLGVLALIGAAIAMALLPLVKRLSLAHETSRSTPAR